MGTERRRGLGLLVGPVCVMGCLMALLVLGVNRLSDVLADWFQVERQLELAKEERALRLRNERRKETIWALIDGRMTLLEAATVCAAIRAEVVVIEAMMPPCYLGYSRDEQECLMVIDLTRDELVNQPSRAKSVRERLQAELQELRKRGPIRLARAQPVAALRDL